MDWRVPLADLDYGEEETQAVLDVLNSRWLTMGAITQEFEDRFADFLGIKHAIAVTNATVALHLACLALGIGPGDDVIVPSLTFVATANAVLYTGAQVRFADIVGPDELNISPDDVINKISPRTKAIIVVHYGGYPCRMPDILDIASRYGLHVIEDSAHAPGATLDGQAMGSWGDIGCFSFFSNKNLSTGEGGMFVTNDDQIANKVRLLRSHGMTSLTWDRHKGHSYTYDVVDLGYNYRIDEIHSTLGLVQLKKLTSNNTHRKITTEKYWQDLEGANIGLPFRDYAQKASIKPSYHLFPILLSENGLRHKFQQAMQASGIQTSIHYPPIHQFSYYRDLYPEIVLPFTEDVASREVTLPLYPTMEEQERRIVIEALRKAV